MRKLFLLFLLFVVPAFGHTVSLSWTVSLDDTTANCVAAGACQQTVYRAPGACSASSVFVSLGVIAASQGTYTDANVTTGTWCYAVSFTLNGVESVKDTVTVSLSQPTPPTGLAVTGKT